MAALITPRDTEQSLPQAILALGVACVSLPRAQSPCWRWRGHSLEPQEETDQARRGWTSEGRGPGQDNSGRRLQHAVDTTAQRTGHSKVPWGPLDPALSPAGHLRSQQRSRRGRIRKQWGRRASYGQTVTGLPEEGTAPQAAPRGTLAFTDSDHTARRSLESSQRQKAERRVPGLGMENEEPGPDGTESAVQPEFWRWLVATVL